MMPCMVPSIPRKKSRFWEFEVMRLSCPRIFLSFPWTETEKNHLILDERDLISSKFLNANEKREALVFFHLYCFIGYKICFQEYFICLLEWFKFCWNLLDSMLADHNHHHQVVFHKYRPSLLNWRRARFAGHCYGSKDQIISDVICMRFPRTSRGRRPFKYIDCIAWDINQDIIELPNLMADRVSWQSIVNTFSDASAWWWWWWWWWWRWISCLVKVCLISVAWVLLALNVTLSGRFTPPIRNTKGYTK